MEIPGGGSGSGISASGGSTTTPGNGYKYHFFTSSGSLVVSAVRISGEINYLVVAGGGAGGGEYSSPNRCCGGGGGAGFRTGTSTLSAQTYPVTVGTGGNLLLLQEEIQEIEDLILHSIQSPVLVAVAVEHIQILSLRVQEDLVVEVEEEGQVFGAGNTPPSTPPQGNNGGASPPANGTPYDAGAGRRCWRQMRHLLDLETVEMV